MQSSNKRRRSATPHNTDQGHGSSEGNPSAKSTPGEGASITEYTYSMAIEDQAKAWYCLYDEPPTLVENGSLPKTIDLGIDEKVHYTEMMAKWDQMNDATREVHIHSRHVFLSAPSPPYMIRVWGGVACGDSCGTHSRKTHSTRSPKRPSRTSRWTCLPRSCSDSIQCNLTVNSGIAATSGPWREL